MSERDDALTCRYGELGVGRFSEVIGDKAGGNGRNGARGGSGWK